MTILRPCLGRAEPMAVDASSVGFLAAFAAGAVSFLSPCVLPLVPGYVSYVAGQSAAGAAAATRTRSTASVLIVPANTAAPGPLRTGVLSPVTGASLIAPSPLMISPSAAMRSPGRIRMVAPPAHGRPASPRCRRCARPGRFSGPAPSRSGCWQARGWLQRLPTTTQPETGTPRPRPPRPHR